MKEYDFTIKFDLPDPEEDPEHYVDALYEAGCSDASVGIGQVGRIGLNFIREADSAFEAVSSAIADVKKAIPNARLIEATPDLVGLTDIAEIVGCSRQNMRKMFSAHRAMFPQPVHDGSVALWHLSKVLQCFRENGTYEIEDGLIEVSSANMQINLARQMRDIDPSIHRNLQSLVA